MVLRLDAAGKLDETDPVLVEAYAVNVAMLREAEAALEVDGVMLVNGNGTSIVHPACAVVNSATMRIKSVLDGIGKVAATSAPKQSKWGGVFGASG